jgi:hypothetical protein
MRFSLNPGVRLSDRTNSFNSMFSFHPLNAAAMMLDRAFLFTTKHPKDTEFG